MIARFLFNTLKSNFIVCTDRALLSYFKKVKLKKKENVVLKMLL